MESTLDTTSLSTILLFESRLHRLEHILYGEPTPNRTAEDASIAEKLEDLERRFASLVTHVRVYNELFKIYKAYPSLFLDPEPSTPPPDMPLDAVKSIVLASASSFPATESALRAVNDCQVPDPAQSAALISQMERMKALETTQLAQAAEIAELRTRSEKVIRGWYEDNALASSEFIAEMEHRVSLVERLVRRAEKEEESQGI
ncbi:hypothetical protein SAPIO_CDS10032 [Scedosporium apiospermum]|uniref:Nuclear distribution protein n=1 Tax=Pseudallescheria apiosperma TaxID=563466 RepID=A0A084FW79_PSEDA|nr:uncharacterized protein SAPIO_CDS10032 [Scedosporium apiospermum]KEZ39341.1 hypothetical protein SAPIO_CDS10032 [Scedosporium apiospermum]